MGPIYTHLVSISKDQKRSVNHIIQTNFQSLAQAARSCSRLQLRGWSRQSLLGKPQPWPALLCPAVRKPYQQLPCLCCERGAAGRGVWQYLFTQPSVLRATGECHLSLAPHTSQGQTLKVLCSQNAGASGNNFVPEEKVDLSFLLSPIVVANSCFQGHCVLVFFDRNNIINMYKNYVTNIKTRSERLNMLDRKANQDEIYDLVTI